VVLARSTYGGEEFCSALTAGNVTGFQFHPERSGPAGLRVYQNLATMLTESR
jgi:glutamine amidotransferase